MCLILFAQDVHPDYRLVLAANRDEFLARPTAPAGFWDGATGVLAGRDLVAGGTWLGLSREGALAAVTNIREPGRMRPEARSRGELVPGMLGHPGGPTAYLESLDGSLYNGFNAVAFPPGGAVFGTNRGAGVADIAPGIHGLSNASLDTPWPKVVSGKRRLNEVVNSMREAEPDLEPLFALLASEERAADGDLPETGVGVEKERALSSSFIRMNGYGTRSSTVVLLRRDGHCVFAERTFPSRGGAFEDRRFTLDLEVTLG